MSRPLPTCPTCGHVTAVRQKPLTTRQAAILGLIRRSIEERGVAPTLEELRLALGLRSLGSVHDLLTQLVGKGRIRREYNCTRGITLLDVDPAGQSLRERILVLEHELHLVARLAAPTAQFSNPLAAWNAEAVRDRVLAELAAATSVRTS